MPPLINLEQNSNSTGESYSDYKDMFMYNPTLMWIFDLETLKFLEVNDAALKHYGYTREEFLSLDITDIRPEEEVAALINDIQSTINKVNFAGEWRHKKRNGEIAIMDIISYPFIFNGRPARHVMATDVTEKKKTEQSLRNSEQRFRTIVEGSPDPIIININNKFAYLNPKAIELFKPKDESAIIGKDVLSIVHPDYKAMVGERISKVFNDGIAVETPDEIKLQAFDGTEIWVETVEQPVEYMGKKANVVFFRDITERKKSAEAIQYQEQLLQAMGRLAQVGGWEFDPVTGQGTWTDEVARIHGLNPEDETSRDIGLNFYTKESRLRVEKAIKDAIEKHVPYNLELEIILKDGTHKWVQSYGQPVIEKGNLVKIRGSFQDITRRKIDEKALKESESKYRAFFENSLDAMMLTSPDGRIIQANIAACQLFGYTEEELIQIGRDGIADFTDPNINSFIEERTRTGVAKGELRFIRKDGQFVETEVSSAIFLDANNMQKTSMIIRDITTRKEAERALKDSEERYKTLLELSPVGIAVLTDQVISYINPAGTRLLGASDTRQLVNKSIKDIANIDPFGDPVGDCLNRKDIAMPLEWVMNRIDSSHLVAEVMISPLEIQGKASCQMIFSDVTERIKARQEILRMNAELEQRIEERTAQLTAVNKDLESFAYSVSHDLRAPVRGLNGLTQLLIEKSSNLDDESKRLCNRIMANSQKMGKLIEDLLKFSRASTTEIRKVNVDMNKIVNNALREVADKETLSRFSITVHNLPEVKGDGQLLEQVWINLLSNAIKFSSKKEEPMIEISGYKEGRKCTFIIKDNGAGFNMAYANKLFNVFQRLHSEQEFQGTGAGLAIVQRIILKHGGNIWAESEEEMGATFYFSLPS